MRQLSDGEKFYWKERNKEICHDPNRIELFSNVFANQAIHFVEMHQCYISQNSMGVMNGWSEIEKLNYAWIRIVMHRYQHMKDREAFYRLYTICMKMIRGYTTTIARLITEKTITDEWLDHVITVESQFFSTVPGCAEKEMETRKIWMNYTNYIQTLIRGDEKHYTGGHCIINGKILGTWLDRLFK